jgi:serine/threonine-protein kinase
MAAVPRLQVTVRDTAGQVVKHLTEEFELSELQIDHDEYFDTRLTKIDETEALTSKATVEPFKPVQAANIESFIKGDLWLDRYRIDKEIGRGAMGRVMLARDEMVGENVILKFMHPELTADEDSRERFMREVKYSRKISHPNVIRIHDMLSKDELSAISMEFFESEGIDEILRKKKYFEPREGLEILLQVSDGMAAAHNQDVIHRDLKPSNILMDNTGLVKVVDFGIASASNSKSTEEALTQVGSIIGTPAYISPERARGREADRRCDIYALGVIAYSMLCGELPYRGEPMALLFQHIKGTAKPLQEVKESVGTAPSKLIQKMMAVKQKDRFQTMEDVSAAIRQILKDLG